MPLIWKFVDRPEASPTVALDMNDGATWKTLGDEFLKLPSPTLRRSIATNNLTDGGLVTSSNYDLRELIFTLELSGATEADRITQLDTLKRELSKPTNLIMYQPTGGSFPVFFRTLRSDQYSLDNQYSGVAWRVSCNVLAEPYAIGTRHDIVAAATVNNDPAAASNPMRLDIAGVRGDSPAPAFATIGTTLAAGAVITVAQRTQNNPTAVTVFAQAESGTMGTDTTVQANDVAMSGAGSNFIRTTFATDNNLTTRVTVSVPTASSMEAIRGRYRVMVKLRRTANTSAFTLRYKVPGTTPSNGPLTTYSTTMANAAQILDLGVVELPSPGPVPATMGYSGLSATFTQPTIEIQARRDTGALSLDLDYVYLLPVDERSMSFQQVASTGFVVMDGPQDIVYGMTSGSTPFGGTRTVDNAGALIPRLGGIPMLVPGVTNRWHVLRPNVAISFTSTWGVSYWPRWREVATS